MTSNSDTFVDFLFVDKDGDLITVYSSEDDNFVPREFFRENYDCAYAWEMAAEAYAALRAHDYGCNY